MGEGAAMGRLFDMVRRVARSDSSVLITGESGTGKELVAHTLHELGARSAHAFVPVNCTAIPQGLLESELFGHLRGAFTGATGDRPGLFEQAHGGTLFLDEIGDMGLDLQAKLLRVLQDGEVRPVGSTRPRKVDVRILAATNKDLRAEVEAGRFREDLFYRLDVIRLHIPPLRERVEDIPALARAFMRRHARGLSRQLSSAALRRLQTHSWPGNARELENVIQRLLVLADSAVITEEDLLDAEIFDGTEDEVPGELASAARRGLSLKEVTDLYMDEVLALTGGRQAEAARRLGINRKTLYRRRRDAETDSPE